MIPEPYTHRVEVPCERIWSRKYDNRHIEELLRRLDDLYGAGMRHHRTRLDYEPQRDVLVLLTTDHRYAAVHTAVAEGGVPAGLKALDLLDASFTGAGEV